MLLEMSLTVMLPSLLLLFLSGTAPISICNSHSVVQSRIERGMVETARADGKDEVK